MNYPVWELNYMGGGLLIALIAIFHVTISHFAVGGGLFLVLSEIKAHKQNSTDLMNYTKKHAKFFMLLTMVAGGITGVGIWFIIALLQPSATSTLIHTFVFGWATEWVCFLGEIIALFIYVYNFDTMNRKNHLIIGWIYFFFAWMSLVLITGIINFMLTPGNWIENQNFWSGFLNPGFLPGTVFRTLLAIVMAGVFGLLTSSFLKNESTKNTMVSYCAKWLSFPVIGLIASGWWYFSMLPQQAKELINGNSPELLPFIQIFAWLCPIILLIGLFLMTKTKVFGKPIALCLIIIAITYMGSFEWIREGARKPWIIYDYMYSNSLLKTDEAKIKSNGILNFAKWVQHRKITDANKNKAGKELFLINCSSCHSIGGPNNDILPLTEKFTEFGMDSMLNGMGKLIPYMPIFMGNLEERKALASFIVNCLHNNKAKETDNVDISTKNLPFEIPKFDKDNDEYVLLAWNNLGMHCISDSDPWWTLLPPANDLFAQLIRRGEAPEIVTEDVEITYAVESGFEHPETKVTFWKHAKSLFGLEKDLPPGTGLSGNKVNGTMKIEEDLGCFEASLVPVVPYPENNSFNPYPLFTITAKEKSTGKILAQTKMVAPTSTEMGCKNCHGGKWKVEGRAGFTDETAMDILAVHDRINHTTLLADAKAGKPQLCQSCHSDPVLGTKGKKGILNFPAAIHGWHVNFLTDRDENACHQCHPSKATGSSGCLRGVHETMDITCVNCHGTLEDHALSLLKHEQLKGKKAATPLMKHIKPRTVDTIAEVNPRQPWINEPDCLTCHVDFQEPETDDAYNTWTTNSDELFRMRTDEMGLMCEACHGSTHAKYPGKNIYGKNRDNIQPLQYQGNNLPIGSNKSCYVCHIEEMEGNAHHENFDREFRNTDLLEAINN